MNNIYAVLLARGGSKGLKRKNIAKLNGISLLERTINDAKNSKFINKIIVSTDDEEIKKQALMLDVNVFDREEYLSNDLATSDSVLQNIANKLNEMKDLPDLFVYLQITEPFRPSGIIDRCIQSLLIDDSKDSAFAAFAMHKNFWVINEEKPYKITPQEQSSIPRQHKRPILREDTGIALAARPEVFLSGRRIGDNPEIITYDSYHSIIDIHTKKDLEFAEFIEEFLLTNEK